MKSNNVTYTRSYPKAKVVRNRIILSIVSHFFGILGFLCLLFWAGTEINVSLWSTAWLLLVGAVCGALSFGGFYLLDVTKSKKRKEVSK